MNRLNKLFTLSSLSVVLVTIERFSFTTHILLQPYSFLRLHELIQMSLLILLTIVIPFYILNEVTENFQLAKSKQGLFLLLLFIIGVYFYATGNGLHEVSSFNFYNFCDTLHFSGDLCGGFFFNDYYTGNILYFVGAAFMVASLLFFEKERPNKNFLKKDILILLINAVVYAFAIFAYSAFDRVIVGLVYSLLVMCFADALFLKIHKKYVEYPIITYTAATYTLGTLVALLFRFH